MVKRRKISAIVQVNMHELTNELSSIGSRIICYVNNAIYITNFDGLFVKCASKFAHFYG